MPTENENDQNKKVEYRKNLVTDAEVTARQRELNAAPKERKNGRFFAWRHYSSLQRDQQRGYHWGYLVHGSPEGNSVQCTCGILIPQGEEKRNWSEPAIHGLPTTIQRTRGHKRLPDQRVEVVAILFELIFDIDRERYVGSGICHECNEMLVGKDLAEVKAFLTEHNRKCQNS